MDAFNQQLKDLELRLRESAVWQGYSFEDDPPGVRVPPGADPEKYKQLDESIRWLVWAKWERDANEVVVNVSPVEEHRFEWAAFEDLRHRYLEVWSE